MTEVRFQTVDRYRRQTCQMDCLGFHLIVIDRSSAMCIDKTDIFGSYSGFFHCLTDSESQAVTGSGRTGDMIGIVADSTPRKQYILCTACRTQ